MDRRQFMQNIGMVVLASALPGLPAEEPTVPSRYVTITTIKPYPYPIRYPSDNFTTGIEPRAFPLYTRRVKFSQ